MAIGSKFHRVKHLIPSIIIYFLGMASFMLSDILIVKLSPDHNTVADWAFIKSSLGVASLVAIFGAEQSILRFPQNLLTTYKAITLRTIINTFIIALLLTILSYINDYTFWFISILALAFSSILYSILRVSLNFSLAQLFTNLWKILLLPLVLIFTHLKLNDFKFIFTISIVLSLIVLSYFLYRNKYWITYFQRTREEPVDQRHFFSLSRFFIISALTLNISVSFEQLLLNLIGEKNLSAILLAHTSILLPLVLLINGISSFFLGPYVKNNQQHLTSKSLTSLISICLTLGGVLFSFSYLLAPIIFSYIYNDMFFNYQLSIGILIIGFLRIMYIIPSSFIGVIGRDDLTKKYIFYNLLILIIVVMITLYFQNSSYIFSIIITLSILNWAYRVLLGIYYSYINLNFGGISKQ